MKRNFLLLFVFVLNIQFFNAVKATLLFEERNESINRQTYNILPAIMANQRLFSDPHFDFIFHKSVNPYATVGRIVAGGFGTGTLIGYDPNSQEFEGITARHNLVLRNYGSFCGCCSTVEIEPHALMQVGLYGGDYLGDIQINRIIPDYQRDVALFYGSLISGHANSHLIQQSLANISQIDITPNQPFHFYHYPDGDDWQRLNNGQCLSVIDNAIEYRDNTLPGSSGAALFNNNGRIVGIHVNGDISANLTYNLHGSWRNNVLEFPNHRNRSELINQNYVDTIRNSKSYNMSGWWFA